MDPAFAKAQGAVFEADWARAKPITLAQWENRSWTEKLAGEAAALVGGQL
jgi:cardiolipin synthase